MTALDREGFYRHEAGRIFRSEDDLGAYEAGLLPVPMGVALHLDELLRRSRGGYVADDAVTVLHADDN